MEAVGFKIKVQGALKLLNILQIVKSKQFISLNLLILLQVVDLGCCSLKFQDFNK